MEVYLTKRAKRDAQRLPTTHQRHFENTLRALVDMPPAPGGMRIESFAGRPGIKKFRCNRGCRGGYAEHEGRLYVLTVGHHDDAYQRLRHLQINFGAEAEPYVYPHVEASQEDIPADPSTARHEAAPTACTLPRPLGHVSVSDLIVAGFPEPAAEHLVAASDDEIVEMLKGIPTALEEAVLAALGGGSFHYQRSLISESHPEDGFAVDAQSLREFRRWLAIPVHLRSSTLHPRQHDAVELSRPRPVRIVGPAGSGKSAVCLHRAVRQAREGQTVALVTFSRTLVGCLESDLNLLLADEPEVRRRVKVDTVFHFVETLPGLQRGQRQFKTLEDLRKGAGVSEEVAESWHQAHLVYPSLEKILPEVPPRLHEGVRRIHEHAQAYYTPEMLTQAVRRELGKGKLSPPTDTLIVDEFQDIEPDLIRFFAELFREGKDCLAFVGDREQSIYGHRVYFSKLGVDLRGAAVVLPGRLRNHPEIARYADAMLQAPEPGELPLEEGSRVVRHRFAKSDEEADALAEAVGRIVNEGARPGEVAIIVPKRDDRLIRAALARAGVPHERVEGRARRMDTVDLLTHYRAKGLTYRAVFVPALQSLPDLARFIHPEEPLLAQRLLYVSCTRAQDSLWLSWCGDRPLMAF